MSVKSVIEHQSGVSSESCCQYASSQQAYDNEECCILIVVEIEKKN